MRIFVFCNQDSLASIFVYREECAGLGLDHVDMPVYPRLHGEILGRMMSVQVCNSSMRSWLESKGACMVVWIVLVKYSK